MSVFMRIPQHFGQASDILFYSAKCQFDTLGYYRKISNIDNVKTLSFDGTTDYIVAKFDSKSGWFPQIGSTFFLKCYLPEDTDLYSKNFGVFGSGEFGDVEKNDFWGLSVRSDPVTKTKMFYLTISNLLQTFDIPFRGFSFTPYSFPVKQFNSIALLQNSTYAELYINGNLVSKVNFPFTPETNDSYKNIYIGTYGNTQEYPGMKMFIKEIGLWERPIEQRDILDLHKINLVSNKGTSDKAQRIKIDSGKFYYDGEIHNIEGTSIYINSVDKETIYILIKETLITEEEDIDLLDNSSNTYNQGKPGMHRIKYEYSYDINTDTSNLPSGTFAIKFLEFQNGVKVFSLDNKDDVVENTDPVDTSNDVVTEIGGSNIQAPVNTQEVIDLVSKYLYEMLGNFIYKGLSISMIDKDSANYQISIGSGTYYLNGTRYELFQNTYMDVSKSMSLTSITNEYIKVAPNKPVLLSQQPVANKYILNGIETSGVSRALLPTQHTKTINVTREDPNGEDVIDVTAIKILSVYKGQSVETATAVYNPSSYVDAPEGDYYFYNGRIKWNPNSLNKPSAAINGISTDSYNVKYVKYQNCTEGVDRDFVLIKGDRLANEKVIYKGKNINNLIQYNLEYLISARVTIGSNVYNLSQNDFHLEGSLFRIEKDIPFLFAGDTIDLYYSYNSLQNVKPYWHILFFENGDTVIDESTDGIIDYKYYLSDIYTLAIDVDNSFRLYRGIPGYRGQTIKSSVPDSSLQIADILVDPDGAEYCKITPHNLYKVHVSDMRNLMTKVSNIETNIALTELEKIGESKADVSNLKGMFVDPLSNYSRSDITGLYNAFIDVVRERLYSGFDKSIIPVTVSETRNYTLGKEVIYPINNDTFTIADCQYSMTGEEQVNKVMLSDVKAQVVIYNDHSYNQEETTAYIKNVLDAVQLSQLAILPINSEVSVSNSSDDGSTNSNSSLIQYTLEKFKVFYEGMGLNTVVAERTFVVVGKGFIPNEKNITVKVNNKLVDTRNVIALSVNYSDQKDNFVTITENNTEKRIKIINLQLKTGWNTTEYAGIQANEKGEFVVSITIPRNFGIVTGIQSVVFSRYENSPEPITVLANLNGVLDSLKNVINTGSRGNITFYDCPSFSKDFVPGLVQPINQITATVTALSLYFKYIDYSLPILVDIYEMNGLSIVRTLARKMIYSASDFKNINNGKHILELDYPVNLINTKSYAIGISTENSSIKVGISEVGKPSQSIEDKNVIVSKIRPLYSIIGIGSNSSFILNSDGKKGMNYEIHCVDNALAPKNSSGYIENIIRYNTIEFSDLHDRFNLCCDYDPTVGFNRKIHAEYSIDPSTISDSAKNWLKIVPNMLIVPKEKFRYLSIRFVLASGNDHYVPSIPRYPVILAYKFKENSAYYSKYFESGIVDGSGNTNINIYMNSEMRAGSDYGVYVSPDVGLTWRECSLIDSSITGNTTSFILREEKYRYECRLAAPVILEHEIIPEVLGSVDNGNFDESNTASYIVSCLDGNGSVIDPKELYNLGKDSKSPEPYYVGNISGRNNKIKLKIQIDTTCKGFRVYRALNGSDVFSQIYNSTATTNVPASISQSDIDPYRIPANNTLEFPRSGVIKINNELIQYDGVAGNQFMVTDKGRGYFNSTVNQIRPGDTIELYDYATEHENIINGQVPRIYSTKSFFEFVDDNIRFNNFSRLAKSLEQRSDNDTVSYPTGLIIKVELDNAPDITESSSLFNLICNVENN